MKTMGLRRLCITGEAAFDKATAERLAVHALDVLRSVERVHYLEEAVRDCALVAGVTRRRGQKRKYVYYSPRQLAEKINKMKGAEIAVVFGNETSGLSDDELAQCHMAVSIPSSPECPSLNLSHAVQLIAYELYVARLSGREGETESYRPLDGAGLKSLTTAYIDMLHSIGFSTREGPRGMPVFLRDIFARASLTEEEAERLASLAEKIDGLFKSTALHQGKS